MNYLAHAYLSHQQPGIMTGNMISDFVKGKSQFDLPPRIQKGIRLHRAIDTFTDNAEATAFIKNMFRPRYRLCAGALTDVAFDHFLANDRGIFQEEFAIDILARNIYADLDLHENVLPPSFLPVWQGMKKNNWLVNYRHEWAIERSFRGLAMRSPGIGETDTAFSIFMERKEEMRQAYDSFFPLINAFSRDSLNEFVGDY